MKKKLIEIYGVPMDLGQSLRGVDMGPTSLRIAGIDEAIAKLGFEVKDFDDVSIANRVSLKQGDSSMKYVAEIARSCAELHDIAKASKERGAIPIFLGGDHSIAVGTISGVANFYADQRQELGVVWIDAHADMNTPNSSPSGNVHGMPLATLLGHGSEQMLAARKGCKLNPKKVFIIGARDLDEGERKLVREVGVNVFTMSHIDELGMAEVVKRSIKGASEGTAGIHVSLDIDGLDPTIAPGVGTPVRGGINYREAHLLMELLAHSQKVTSLDIVELNPIRDTNNESAELVVHLVESLFGSKIL